MKTTKLILLFSLLFVTYGCKNQKKNKSTQIFESKDTIIALDFVNYYVKKTDNQEQFNAKKWIEDHEFLTPKFKAEYAKMIVTDEPIGADIILSAQDYPPKGYKVTSFDQKTGLVRLEGIDYPFFLAVQLEKIDNKKLIDGCGIVNIPDSIAFPNQPNEQTDNKIAHGNFSSFLRSFLDTYYWNKNIFAQLRDDFETLAPILDSKIGFIRFCAPGTTLNAYKKEDNYGFETIGANFEEIPKNVKLGKNTLPYPYESPCDFNIDKQEEGVFYRNAEALPSTVTFTDDDFKIIPTTIPYKNAEIMEVLHISADDVFILYFVNTPTGWKLVASNESACES